MDGWMECTYIHTNTNIHIHKYITLIYINKYLHTHTHIYIYIYTECPRMNVPDFGRVFLMLKYTDIPQNTYIQS